MKTVKKKTQLNHNINKNIMNILKSHISDMDIKFSNKKFSNNIYNTIKKAYIENKKILYDYNLNTFINKNNLNISKFLDQEIIDEINEKLNYVYNVTFSYKNIDFYINIYFDNAISIHKYIMYIKLIICICLNDKNNITKEKFIFDLYLTDRKKYIEKNFINGVQPLNVNSGYSLFDENMTICIYRKEEWLKVFIHECFHTFNMDFHEEDIDFKSLFSNTFFINSDFLLFEPFVEFWARILNCGIFSYFLKDNINSQDFYTIFSLNLNIERIHSILQGSKLLNMFELSYKDIIDKDKSEIVKKIYKENTNAFCYYIITGILMNYFDKTLQWFDLNNTKLYSFDKNKKQVIIFCHYIIIKSKKKETIEIFDKLNISKIKNINYFNMCIFEVIA